MTRKPSLREQAADRAHRRRRRHAVLLFAVLGCFGSSSAWPQQGAATQGSKPPVAAPEMAAKTKMALKLAGLVSFVASSCRDLRPDYAKFKGALAALGVSTNDLETTDLKAAYLSYALRYKENVAGNCARALTDFGPDGKVIADLLRPQVDAQGLSRKPD